MKLWFSGLMHGHMHLFYAWLQQILHMQTTGITVLMATFGRKQSTSPGLLRGSNVTFPLLDADSVSKGHFGVSKILGISFGTESCFQ